jgi:hypothetical protein
MRQVSVGQIACYCLQLTFLAIRKKEHIPSNKKLLVFGVLSDQLSRCHQIFHRACPQVFACEKWSVRYSETSRDQSNSIANAEKNFESTFQGRDQEQLTSFDHKIMASKNLTNGMFDSFRNRHTEKRGITKIHTNTSYVARFALKDLKDLKQD